jgi:carbon monoxide dehydrogenase subunit G
MKTIDASAPVVGSSEIEIAAAPEVAWEILIAIEKWPSWNPDVRSASVEGPLDKGTTFRWKAGPGTITSQIADLERPRRISWAGKTLGIKAIHVYTLEPSNGKTLVRTEESYGGLMARLFHGRLQKTLDNALRRGLEHLKAEAERRQRGQPSSGAKMPSNRLEQAKTSP